MLFSSCVTRSRYIRYLQSALAVLDSDITWYQHIYISSAYDITSWSQQGQFRFSQTLFGAGQGGTHKTTITANWHKMSPHWTLDQSANWWPPFSQHSPSNWGAVSAPHLMSWWVVVNIGSYLQTAFHQLKHCGAELHYSECLHLHKQKKRLIWCWTEPFLVVPPRKLIKTNNKSKIIECVLNSKTK